MSLTEVESNLSVGSEDVGKAMFELVSELFPICRSITGEGVRETLRVIGRRLPLEVHNIPSGTKVLDWTVPREWNIRDAWIKNSAGERMIDFRANNLHVVGYSVPVRRKMRLAELREHLFTVPDHPDWIPYRTTYYKEDWGFCLSERQLGRFRDKEEYEVCIDSSLEAGLLTYGEYVLPGNESGEVLISTHVCHPSLANDNLSGVAVAVYLAQQLAKMRRRYTYRFVFVPATIGAITWLACNEDALPRICHGLVLTCVGDSANITYKRSRHGDAAVDRAFAHVLKHSGASHEIIDFFPYGYDERQYCSPGFDLPVGCLMRSRHGLFPEYHTSADNLKFVRADALADSLAKAQAVFELLEQNRTYVNLLPKGEPQLGTRGLYAGLSAGGKRREHELALLWVLNFCDGEHDLLAIADRAGLQFDVIETAASALGKAGLLRAIDPTVAGTAGTSR